MDYEAFGAFALIIGGAIPIVLLVFFIVHVFVKSQRKENARIIDSVGNVLKHLLIVVMCIVAFYIYVSITSRM